MTDRDALYRAICASPDEDTPRLAFADWLEEHGEADRATFVRAQVEFARAEPFAKPARDARQRADALLNANWKAWTAAVYEHAPVTGCQFERGFVGHVSAGSAGFHDAADALFAAHPVESLWLVQPEAPGDRTWLAPIFTDLACLGRLRRLGFAPRTEFLDDEYAALVESPHLTGLRDLSLVECPIDPPWLSALLEGDGFPDLAGLNLAENTHLGPCLAKSLPQAAHRRLRRLNLSDVRFSSEQLQRVLASRCLEAVEELRLVWDDGRKGEPGPLFHLTISWVIPWDRLTLLDLTGQRLGDEVAHQLADRVTAPRLRWLGLAGNDLTRDGVRALARSRQLNLYHLDVRGNGLDAHAVADLQARFPDAVVMG